MKTLSQIWSRIQKSLFPFLEEALGLPDEKQKKLAAILEVIQIEKHVNAAWWGRGRPLKDRKAIARAFVANDIVGREKAEWKAKKKEGPKRKRGRPKAGEERPPKEPTRLERQKYMTLDEMLSDLPKGCDYGTKKKDGKPYYWQGYKLHVDCGDGEVPISCVLTAASVHDSQVAIPLATMSAERVTSLYDLMDAAYDAKEIWETSASLGHVAIIDVNPRGKEKVEMEPAKRLRFNERSTAERGFSMLKEGFGGGNIRVRGQAKVFAHLMFGILAMTAERLINMLL